MPFYHTHMKKLKQQFVSSLVSDKIDSIVSGYACRIEVPVEIETDDYLFDIVVIACWDTCNEIEYRVGDDYEYSCSYCEPLLGHIIDRATYTSEDVVGQPVPQDIIDAYNDKFGYDGY